MPIYNLHYGLCVLHHFPICAQYSNDTMSQSLPRLLFFFHSREANSEPMEIVRAGRGARADRERRRSEECSDVTPRCSEVGGDTKEELPEGPQIALAEDTAETKPHREPSEGLHSLGTDLAERKEASTRGVLENSQHLLDRESAEHPTTAGSRVTEAALPPESKQQGSLDQPQHMGQEDEVEQLRKSQRDEISLGVLMGETEWSAQHEVEVGERGGGTETRQAGLTEMETAGVSSDPLCLGSAPEPDLTVEPVSKPRVPEHCVTESDVSPAETESTSVERPMDQSEQTAGEAECSLDTDGLPTVVAAAATNGDESEEPAGLHMNGGSVDRKEARRLAERLYRLEEVQRVDVVKHMDKE